MDTSKNENVKKHTGGCHCGAVRYEVSLDASAGSQCNCTICVKTAITGSMVKPAAFKLLKGEDAVSMYEWGGKTGKRYFCKHCGIHCYGIGHLEQLGGDYVSINLNTVDDFDPHAVKLIHWDGRHNNWQAGPRPAPWPVNAG